MTRSTRRGDGGRSPLRSTTVAAVTVASLVVAQSASAASAWSPLRSVTDDHPVAIGAFASNDAGDAIAAWIGADTEAGSVFSAVRDPDGSWRVEPVRVWSGAGDANGIAAGTDARGGHVLVWAERIEGRSVPVVARRAPGAVGWREPQPLADAPGSVAGSSKALTAVVDPAGRVTVVWLAQAAAGSLSVRYARSSMDGSWIHGQVASRAGSGGLAVEASVARDGTVVASWLSPDGRPRIAVTRSDGRWSAPRAVPRAMTTSEATAAPGGGVVVTGVGRMGVSARALVARSRSGGPFEAPMLLDGCSPRWGLSVTPAAVDGAGRVTVAWSCTSANGRTTVRSTVAGARWRFAAPALLAAGRDAGAVQSVAVSRSGRAVATWSPASSARRYVYAAVRPRPAGPWAAASRVTGPQIRSPRDTYTSVDRRGRATIGIAAPERALLATLGPTIR